MPNSARKKAARTGNRLLDRLRPADLKTLSGAMDSLQLPARHVLFDADEPLEYVYFPVTAVLSLVMPPTPPSAVGVEIASVGSEGAVGFTALLGVPTSFHQAVCHVPGDCLRLPMSVLAEAMARRPTVAGVLMRYVALAYRTVAQVAVCNALHRVEQRVCRWLLVMHDKAAGDFPATQDFLASRLGVKRPTISIIANTLLREGLITYHRGTVRILDTAAMEQAACDCFRITRAAYEQIIEG